MAEIQIRRASPEDGYAISLLKNTVWSHESTDGDYCARVIAEPDHITHVAVNSNQIVGFVDGFLTYAPDGLRRWEVDLLAVAETARNQGIAQKLIADNLAEAASTWSIDYARTLIQVDNLASQKAFAKCDFIMSDSEYRQLYVAQPDSTTTKSSIDERSFIIPVTTLSYQGLWLEGVITLETLHSARAILHKHQLNTAGLLIHFADTQLIEHAEQSGYTFIAKYNWWYHYLKA